VEAEIFLLSVSKWQAFSFMARGITNKEWLNIDFRIHYYEGCPAGESKRNSEFWSVVASVVGQNFP